MHKSRSLLQSLLRPIGFRRVAKCKPRRDGFARSLRCESLEERTLLSIYYVDAVNGNDSNAGTLAAPWKTVYKVNLGALGLPGGVAFQPGDSILFHRGQVWRENLYSDYGSPTGGMVTYGAYGDPSLPKPELLGSSEFDSSSLWTNEGNNVWSTPSAFDMVTATGSEKISNGTFTNNVTGWTPSPSGTTFTRYTSDPAPHAACGKLTSGSGSSSIALRTTTNMSLLSGATCYLLTFSARTDVAGGITLPSAPTLEKKGTPSADYGFSSINTGLAITSTWTQYKVLIESVPVSAPTDAVLAFYLGTTLPAGKSFFIDDVSLKQVTSTSAGCSAGRRVISSTTTTSAG